MAEKAKQFGMYQKASGSFTAGGLRFTPLRPVEIPSEMADKLDASAPVRTFPSVEKAQEDAAKLRDKFARKSKT